MSSLHHDIGDDDPVTLDEACRLFFRGVLTKSSLRTESRKGNLEIIRIANKDFVTRKGVKRMIEKCHKSESRPGFTSEQTKTVEVSQSAHGSSATERPISAQDALRTKLQKRKENSANTSPKSSSQSAAVVPLTSR